MREARIAFSKLSATGNDFILFDNRGGLFTGRERDFFQRVCRRRVSVGADGVILLEQSARADFRMRYFNADGGESEMCGNGARAVAYYAFHRGIAGAEMTFEIAGQVLQARVEDRGVLLKMPPARDLHLDLGLWAPANFQEGGFINTGVPHYVVFAERLEEVDVLRLGRRYGHQVRFQPQGTNVDFVRVLDHHRIAVRTYERGVEDETLACGTGAVASSIVAHHRKGIQSPVEVVTRGGELRVRFDESFQEITLEGEARIVYEGTLAEP